MFSQRIVSMPLSRAIRPMRPPSSGSQPKGGLPVIARWRLPDSGRTGNSTCRSVTQKSCTIAGIGRLELVEARDLAGLVDHAIGHPGRQRHRTDAIAEEHHLAGFGIDLGMGGEAVGGAGIVEIAARAQRNRIDLQRLVAFFQRQQLAGVPDDVGVGDTAVLAGDGRIGRQRIAERAEQRAAGGMLEFVFRRAQIAVLVGDLAVLDEEGMQHAVAREPVMVRVARRKLRVGTVAIERAAQRFGNFSLDREV